MRHWTTQPCWLCKRLIKTRTVSAINPPFVSLCGLCARAAESVPFSERTAHRIKLIVEPIPEWVGSLPNAQRSTLNAQRSKEDGPRDH